MDNKNDKTKKRLEILEKDLPGIKDIFYNCFFNIKMCGYNNVYLHMNGGSYKTNEVKKYHIYVNTTKIFSFYYDKKNKKMYYKHKDSGKNKLSDNHGRIQINDISELQNILNELIIRL